MECFATEEEEEEVTEEPLAVDREDVVEVVLMSASPPWKDPEAHSEARREREARRMSAEWRDGVKKATCEKGRKEQKPQMNIHKRSDF